MVILNKLYLFAFIFCCLIVVKEIFYFVTGIIKGEYELPKNRMLILGLCVAFIITVLITGFTLL